LPNVEKSTISAGKGGLATLVFPRWSNLISQLGSIFGGKAQWLIFLKFKVGTLDSLISMPLTLWFFILPSLMGNYEEWITYYMLVDYTIWDFNMVEHKMDKSSSRGKILSGPERLPFNSLKDTIQVFEFPRTSLSMAYS